MSFIGAVQHFLYKFRRHKVHAFAVAHHQVPGHHSCVADADGNIDSGHHYIVDRGWIDGAKVRRHVDLCNSLQIADAAVHYQTAAMRGLHHVIKKIVTYDGTV